jgi:hypothetical protein
MSDLVKGVLGGAWSLLVGWILPSAINLLVLGYTVLPSVRNAGIVLWFTKAETKSQGLAVVAGAVVLGLLLATVQKQLYRLLEGYVGWRPLTADESGRSPHAWVALLLDRARQRQLTRKQILQRRMDYAELKPLGPELRPELVARLAAAEADDRIAAFRESDLKRGASQLALLREQVRRYPVSDDQVAPTRLGNAMRRLEEYGFNRYRLDSQALWYELTAVAPEQARKQTEQARTTVDFLIALLWGHLLVAFAGLVALFFADSRRTSMAVAVAALLLLSAVWYRVAVVAIDDWAAATRALVNLGRTALATQLGLDLPGTIDEERTMWATFSRLSQRPFDEKTREGDPFRKQPREEDDAAR